MERHDWTVRKSRTDRIYRPGHSASVYWNWNETEDSAVQNTVVMIFDKQLNLFATMLTHLCHSSQRHLLAKKA